LPASGSFGLFVVASIGQRASALTRAPAGPPSRSGLTLTLITVPTGNDWGGDALSLELRGAGHFDHELDWLAILALFQSLPIIGDHVEGGIRRGSACGTYCFTTPVIVTVLFWSYIANE
jgi:hypothetical protein